MSNKSGTSSQVISLPKGGGALQGIGEKFSPDLFTGTGNFTVPIALPPGRNGFQPELNLVYSTGNGNGPFGLGWSLSIPGVSRKTSKGIPKYQDYTSDLKDRDTFILSGTEDLVPLPTAEESERKTRYRPRTEGLFARIEHHHAPDKPNHWEVRSKDGLVSYYGTEKKPDDAGPEWQDPAVIVNPAKRNKIFAWKLTKTEDTFGNRIEYEYERDTGEDGPHHWDQLYLKQIRYADYTDHGETKFLVSVTFEYEDEDRPDPFSEYRSGFEIRTRRRYTHIEVRTHADEERLVRTYHLTYIDRRVEEFRTRLAELEDLLRLDPVNEDLISQRDVARAELEKLEAAIPLNGVSLLSRIKVVGHDESQAEEENRTEELPPLEFGYTRFEPEGRDFFPVQGRDLPARSLASPDLELADLFGNGLPDILQMNGTVRYWRNLGGGQFDLPREMREAPAGLTLADPGVQLLDANGDGRIDLLATQNGLSGYFPLCFNGQWDRRSFQRYHQAPSFNLADPEVKLVDLTGDGVTDVIRSGTRMECFYNDPKEGWNDTHWVERRAIDVFPDINFSDPRVKWGDMSGDGLQDIVLVYDGNIEYWPNLGYGNWGKRISMRNSPRFPYGYDPGRILIGDVDGDGLADIVYVDDTRVTLWINQSGNGWSDPIEIDGTPPVTDMDAVRLVDLLGTGIIGVLWSRDVGMSSRENYFFFDFTGGLKPYVLNKMDNHMGAVTRVEYTSSTCFYQEDQESPETRWKTPLPFPVQVVARVEVIDQISLGKLTTEYKYHHGYWDGEEREFRGFGLVEQYDTETFEMYNQHGLHGEETDFEGVAAQHFSPPTLTKTWFHQGPVGEEFGEWEETDYSEEYWPDDPQMLDHKEGIDAFLADIPQTPKSRRIKRDALRTLRGSILRTELFALDDSPLTDRPYTVTESAYGLREIENSIETPPEPDEKHRQHIFFPHLVAQRTTQWERGDDPMTQVTFTDEYDPYGQPRQQTMVALPRRQTKRQAIAGTVVGSIDGDNVNETRILATHTRTAYATPDTDLYIHDRVVQVSIFELNNPQSVHESDPNNLFQVLQDQAAAAREIHRQFQELIDARLIGHTINHYDGEAFIGRDDGKVGPYGALTRSEALVFTDRELDAAYEDRRPAYLGGSAEVPPGTPDDFGNNLGYHWKETSPEGYQNGYYVDTQRQQFDFQDSACSQQRGLVVGIEDARGHRSLIEPDQPYWLLPRRVVDQVGLETVAEYDYRLMQPCRVIDPNGNISHFRYTPLGLLHKQFLEGHKGEGGTEEQPETEFLYDFHAYARTRGHDDPQPVFVHTLQRIYHASQNISDEVIESREYSDGFGRLLQTRAQAEELVFGESGDDVGLSPEPGSQPGTAAGRRVADRVVVSGWQTYDNKGQVVEKYEPFFDADWEYQPETVAKTGQHATLYYDPRGQVIRTVNPDGSEQRVIFGIPADIDNPAEFSPTPWESYTYDPNDLAPLSFAEGAETSLTDLAPITHHFTPADTILDALGRVLCQVERNGPNPEEDWYITCSSYDIRGNLLAVTDTLGRDAFTHAYDLLNNPLRIHSIDAGLRTSVLDANSNLAEYRDSKGSIVLRQYDELNRLTHLWAGNNDTEDRLTLREHLIYGDTLDRQTARQHNLLGSLYKHYDEAGVLCFECYDFKGNLKEKTRQVISDAALSNGWSADWNASDAESALDEMRYQTSTCYDALNRTMGMRYPADVDGKRAVLTPRYNRAGALESVDLDEKPYVTQIAYNAKGQRALIAYGNGVMTRYAYDPLTFRLVRLRSEDCQRSSDTWTGAGGPLQDFTYGYDLVGNITSIEDRSPNSGVVNSPHGRDRLIRQFEYDPLYRLTRAGGRACKDIGKPRPVTDQAHCGAYTAPYMPGAANPNQRNAPELTEYYTETYNYDPAGNMLVLRYSAASGSWTRSFGIDGLPPEQWASARNNRLSSMRQNGDTHSFEYDANGNMLVQNTERRYIWDHADRLIGFTNQPQGSEQASVDARYLYGAGGLRVKKWVRKNGSNEGQSTVYIDGIFEHHRWLRNGEIQQNNHLHVMDDQQRIALIRRGPAHPKDAGPPIQYHLGDHLGSSSVVVDDDGGWINREEYFPYGETSFGSFAKKRYRFTGKERDEESGLYYHGARYYTPGQCRWISCDPIGTVDGLNLYNYVNSNPTNFNDLTGKEQNIEPSENEILYQMSHPDLHNTQECHSPSESLSWESAIPTGVGTGLVKSNPSGHTLIVPNSYDEQKMRAYRQGVIKREIGRNAGPDNPTKERRNSRIQKQAREAFKAKNPQQPPGTDIDHIIELQHDLTGQKGKSLKDYRYQESTQNRTEGSRSWHGDTDSNGNKIGGNKNNPQGVPAGGVAKAEMAGKLYNQVGWRTFWRFSGYVGAAYGIYLDFVEIGEAVQYDIDKGTAGAQTARTVASKAGGLASALMGAESGAYLGTWCGPKAYICSPLLGAGFGLIGYAGGQQAVERTIDWLTSW